jgi:small-conductance mechanosensitive channel
MLGFIDNLRSYLDGIAPYETRKDIYYTVFILLLFWLIKTIAIRIIRGGKELEIKKQFYWSKTIEYSLAFVALLLVGNIWIRNFQSITTFLGLLSAGIAIALKDIFINIAGWIFIYWRKPFDVGDRIEIGGHKGDVIDIRLFQFSILEVGNWVDADQSTGRLIHIPNGRVFAEPQANYNEGFPYIWNEQNIYISLDSDYVKAQSILKEILYKLCKDEFSNIERHMVLAQRDKLISFNQYTPTVYIKIMERGIQLSLRYLCPPRKRRIYEHQVTENILLGFRQQSDIKIVYPITNVFLDRA